FTPATTGIYRIFSSPYAGLSSNNDTILGVYADSNFSQLIIDNDDYNGGSFSEIRTSFTGNDTYYVKLSAFDTTPVKARITAEVVSSSIPYIQLDQPVDINEQSGNSKV